MIAASVYLLCAVTSLACAVLLLRAWRASGARLLLWSGLCFAGLAVNNGLLLLDLVVLPDADLRLLRNGTALIALVVLLHGLIAEAK